MLLVNVMYRAYITLSIMYRRIYTLQGVIKIFIDSNKYDILLEHCLRTHLECNSKCFLYLWNCQDCPSRKMHGKLIYSFMHLKNCSNLFLLTPRKYFSFKLSETSNTDYRWRVTLAAWEAVKCDVNITGDKSDIMMFV